MTETCTTGWGLSNLVASHNYTVDWNSIRAISELGTSTKIETVDAAFKWLKPESMQCDNESVGAVVLERQHR